MQIAVLILNGQINLLGLLFASAYNNSKDTVGEDDGNSQTVLNSSKLRLRSE